MLLFCVIVIIAVAAVVLGARYHDQVNSRLNKILNGQQDLPPDFRMWLANHKGEYSTIGAAISAWADAKYGDKYNNLLN